MRVRRALTLSNDLRQSDAMTVILSDQQLMDFSKVHLMHELSMLWESEHALRQHKPGSVEYVALLESFAIHVRNLIEFFYYDESGEYVRAKHFFDDPFTWSPSRPSDVNRLHSRASKEVTHLTTGRVSGNPPEKEWRTGDALALIEAVAKEFAAKASKSKLHRNVIELLNQPRNEVMVWIGKNVSHSSNVHAQVVISTFSASTATVTRGHVILKTP